MKCISCGYKIKDIETRFFDPYITIIRKDDGTVIKTGLCNICGSRLRINGKMTKKEICNIIVLAYKYDQRMLV